ncbi:MAG: hypothetical protein K9L28_09670, partial [Synergistales bacterium]|nr:hypothetical protein [Synergistales bacterium]
VVPSGDIRLSFDESQTFEIAPDSGYDIRVVSVDGRGVGTPGSYTFERVSADHRLEARFEAHTYTITARAGTGGVISPDGEIGVPYSEDQRFAILPSGGYRTNDVLVDGAYIGAVGSHTFRNVSGDHSIYAVFAAVPTSVPTPTAAPAPTAAPTPTPTPVPTVTPTPTTAPITSGDVEPGDDDTGDVTEEPLDEDDEETLGDAIGDSGHTPGSITAGGLSAQLSNGATWATFVIGSNDRRSLLPQVEVDASTLVFAYHRHEQIWMQLHSGLASNDVEVGSPDEGRLVYRVRDQGAFDLEPQVYRVDTKVAVVEPVATGTPTPSPSPAAGGGGGGCALHPSLLTLLLVAVPGLLLLRR